MNKAGGWGLWSKYEVYAADGTHLLTRRRVVRCPWFGVFIHTHHSPDTGKDPHDHPWWFASFVLTGWYKESIWKKYNPEAFSSKNAQVLRVDKVRGMFSLHRISTWWAHGIYEISPEPLRTLVIVGPHVRDWGFWLLAQNEWVPHALYGPAYGERVEDPMDG